MVELKEFVRSLNSQVNIDFSYIQLIFIDQGDNLEAFKALNQKIAFDYLKIEPCSLSHARNVGLPKVNGKYVCFPDDDCWLETDTLAKVFSTLYQGYDGVFIKATDAEGKPVGKFPKGFRNVTLFNHYGAFSPTIFLKYIPNLLFDENLGVGSPHNFSSGEETDYIVNFIRKCDGKILYRDDIIIHHPIGKSTYFGDSYLMKSYYYARGYGYVLRKNNYPYSIVLYAIIRPIIGILFYITLFKFTKAKKSYNLLKGRLEGYFLYEDSISF